MLDEGTVTYNGEEEEDVAMEESVPRYLEDEIEIDEAGFDDEDFDDDDDEDYGRKKTTHKKRSHHIRSKPKTPFRPNTASFDPRRKED